MAESTRFTTSPRGIGDGGAVVAAVAACGLLGVVVALAMAAGELSLLLLPQPVAW
jgi:hypothetical protein